MASKPQRGPEDPTGARKLSLAEARFYATVFSSARKGSLAELCRRGCDPDEAEEIFTTAFERVMRTVDPIERRFSEAQMVNYVKRACWTHFLAERRRRGLRTEIELTRVHPLEDPSSPSPEEIAEDREAVAIGREALQMLAERDRLVFRQRHQMHLSPEEILRNTPGLSLRTYRKIIQRANARVLDAYERIRDGERCEEMGTGLLRRYVAGESPEAERRAVDAHLAHCRFCQKTQAGMRGYLLDVAGAVIASSSLADADRSASLHDAASTILQRGFDAARTVGEASRGARERVREVLLRAAMGPPGSSGGATAGQALSASSLKAASTCAGLAAGACLAAGAVPGIGGVGLLGRQSHAKVPPARSATHLAPKGSALPALLIGPLPGSQAKAPAGNEASQQRSNPTQKTTQQLTEAPASTARPETPPPDPASPARISGRQTGTEVGAESGGTPLPKSPRPPPATSESASRETEFPSEQSSSSQTHSSSESEFGM